MYKILTCNFLQPSHDEQIVLMLGSSCHMLSDSTYPANHLGLGPDGSIRMLFM